MDEEQIEQRRKDGYSEEQPTKVGLYLFVCGENSNISEHVAITHDPRRGLMSHCEDLGCQILSHYHDGLTSPMWKKVA